MATIIDSPLSRTPRNKSIFWSTFENRLSFSVLAVLSFVAVSWRVYFYSDYELFFQSPSKPSNSYGYTLELLNSGVPPVSLPNTKRSLFDENNNNNPNNANDTKTQAHDNDAKDYLDENIQPQQQNLPAYVQKYCDLRITTHHNATDENVEKL
jgi:hypothetical protein